MPDRYPDLVWEFPGRGARPPRGLMPPRGRPRAEAHGKRGTAVSAAEKPARGGLPLGGGRVGGVAWAVGRDRARACAPAVATWVRRPPARGSPPRAGFSAAETAVPRLPWASARGNLHRARAPAVVVRRALELPTRDLGNDEACMPGRACQTHRAPALACDRRTNP